jgi:hypothetical protein
MNSGLVIDQTVKGGFRFRNIGETKNDAQIEVHDTSSDDVDKA